MTFMPVNNYLHIEVVAEKKEETGVLLPQDYRPADNPFAVARLISASYENCWTANSILVVEAHMLRDIQHNGETFTVIKENHVIGVLSETS